MYRPIKYNIHHSRPIKHIFIVLATLASMKSTKSHKEILDEIREIKEDTAEAVKIQYGLKEFFQGLMIGIIGGFMLAWILFKYI